MSLKKTKGRRRGGFRWGRWLLIALVLLGGFRLGDKISHSRDMEAEAELYRQQLAVVQAEYQAKQDTIRLLDDDAYIERIARENLGMVKAGETVVSVVEVAAPPVPPEAGYNQAE